MLNSKRLSGLAMAVSLLLAACAQDGGELVSHNYPRRDGGVVNPNPKAERETVFGPGGLNFATNLLGGDRDEADRSGNSLWQASLASVSDKPIVTADLNGRLIVTDWYADPSAPKQRTKINILVGEEPMPVTTLKVTVFRQARDDGRTWGDAEADPVASAELAHDIKRRANELLKKERR